MEFFRIKRDIPFMRHALVFNVISFLTFAAAVFFLVTRGLHFSIEFTGGTVIEVAYPQAAEIDKTRHLVEKMGYGEVQVQNFGSSRDVMIRLPVRPGEKQTEVVGKVFAELCKAEAGSVSERQEITPQGEQVSKQACAKADGAEPIKLSRSEVVGPAVGAELALDAAKALAMTVVGIMIYLARSQGAIYNPDASSMLLSPIIAIAVFQLCLVLFTRSLEEIFNPRLRSGI